MLPCTCYLYYEYIWIYYQIDDGLDTMTLTYLNVSLLEGRSMQELEVTRWVIEFVGGIMVCT
jgi:hypothetical protein